MHAHSQTPSVRMSSRALAVNQQGPMLFVCNMPRCSRSKGASVSLTATLTSTRGPSRADLHALRHSLSHTRTTLPPSYLNHTAVLSVPALQSLDMTCVCHLSRHGGVGSLLVGPAALTLSTVMLRGVAQMNADNIRCACLLIAA